MHDVMPPEIARGLYMAQTLFHRMLHGEPHPAHDYLRQRNVQEAHVPVYGLGVGKPGYRTVLEQWGVSVPTQHELGLVDDRGQETMVDRVTFPWLSMAGRRVIGIGGRSIRDGERRPKYDNSPERPWFAKGKAVFGLAQSAKAIHGSWALIVEGPFDAIALARMGWTNAVATVGAKVTLDQLLLVARLTNEIVVMLDDDEGGHRGREAVQQLVRRHPLPAALTVHTAALRGVKDAASAGCTPELVATAVRAAIPAHR